MSSLFGLGGAGNVGASGSFYDYSIDQSLRFNDNDSAQLTRTPSSAGNRKTWTFSCWVKRSNLPGTSINIFSTANSGPGYTILRFHPNNKLYFYANTGNSQLISDAIFRDTSAWLHVMAVQDSTNTTAADRMILYVNGEKIPQSYDATYGELALDFEGSVNNTVEHYIGSYASSQFFDGYIAEAYLIDGQALTPTSFGQDSNGIWVPKTYSGSFGTNGFYLPFSQDTANSASVYFNQDDDGFLSWTDPGTEYVIGSSDDYTLELFFNPTSTELSGNAYIAGYYKTTTPSGFFAIQTHFSTRNIYLYHANGAAYTFGTYSVGDVVAGRWHHLAINRSSGNLRCFLDGTQVGSTLSNTKAHDIPEFRVNKAHATSSNTFDGYISNVRLVIGSAVYADGSSITVPTSPLTAVTNTKILACTTTTITEDASSNDVTGSSNNSGFFSSSVSPFATSNFYDDASGNNNDWTAENVQDIDVVPDSPTNNFATMNSLDKSTSGAFTFSEGNLKTQAPGTNWVATRSSMFVSSGQWYWECRFNAGTMTEIMNGIADVTVANTTNIWTQAGTVLFYNNNGGEIRYNGGTETTNNYGTFVAGDILGVALDMDAKTISFYKNGTIIVNSFNINYTNVDTVSPVGVSDASNVIYAWNFGQDSTFAGATTAGGNSDENGVGDFKYSVPSGFLALASSSLPEPDIGPNSTTQADDYFDIALYSGNGTAVASGGNAITSVNFAPEFVWLKRRDAAANHAMYSVVQGAGVGVIPSQDSYASFSDTETLNSFDSNGFTLGSNTTNNASSSTNVSWNWKLGGTTTVDNSAGAGAVPTAGSVKIDGSNSTAALAGTIAALRQSVNTTAGISITKYVGTGSNATIAHSLTETPELVICKNLDDTKDFMVFCDVFAATQYLRLNGPTDGIKVLTSSSAIWNDTAPTSTVVSLGTSSHVNTLNDNHIMWAFHSVEGYCKITEYISNGDADGPFCFLGFKPRLVIIRRTSTSSTGRWPMYNTETYTYNSDTEVFLRANQNDAEISASTRDIDILSNGIKIRNTSGNINASSGEKYLVIAWAENPFKYVNAR